MKLAMASPNIAPPPSRAPTVAGIPRKSAPSVVAATAATKPRIVFDEPSKGRSSKKIRPPSSGAEKRGPNHRFATRGAVLAIARSKSNRTLSQISSMHGFYEAALARTTPCNRSSAWLKMPIESPQTAHSVLPAPAGAPMPPTVLCRRSRNEKITLATMAHVHRLPASDIWRAIADQSRLHLGAEDSRERVRRGGDLADGQGRAADAG